MAEALLLIKMAEHDADIVEKVSFFLDNISDLEKKEEIETIYNLFISYWSESNKQAFLQALNTYEKSRWIYEEYMLLMPFYVHIYDDLIDSLKQLNEKQIQFKYMKRALEIQPDNALRHFNYAYAMSDIPGYVDEVIYHYEQCDKLGLSDKAVKHNLACQYNQKKRNYQRAIALLEENLIAYPQFVESMLELSNAYSRSGNLDRAEELLVQSVEINSNYHSGYNNLAFFYWNKRQKYEEALAAINKALELEGTKGLYWHTLAEVEWYGFKNKEKALSALHKAMEVEPSYKDALGMIAEIEND